MKEKVFWWKNKVLRSQSYRAYLESLEFDKASGEEKENIEFAKVKKLVTYAYNHVPFYNKLYNSKGFTPDMLTCLQDINLVPVLEKDIIRKNPDCLLSDEYRLNDLSSVTTGGSTGTPLKLYKMKDVPVEVMGWRALMWWGLDPSDNIGILHRRTPTRFIDKLKNRLLWWPTKRAYLNATKISESEIDQFVHEINAQNTKWLQGYCSALESVADYIIRNSIRIHSLKLVWCTSSPLSNIVRKKMEEAFHCSVMDQYGCCEMWNIAMQKPGESCLTLCNDFVHVDVVDEKGFACGQGEKGDILITDLNSFAFPLIRYRLGDKGSIFKTAKESHDGYPKLSFVEGRITDSIYLPDGTHIDGAYLTTICDAYPDVIDSFQIYQDEDYSVELRLILKPCITDNNQSVKDIVSAFRKKLGSVVPFSYTILDNIPGDNGKKRYIISKIALSKQR